MKAYLTIALFLLAACSSDNTQILVEETFPPTFQVSVSETFDNGDYYRLGWLTFWDKEPGAGLIQFDLQQKKGRCAYNSEWGEWRLEEDTSKICPGDLDFSFEKIKELSQSEKFSECSAHQEKNCFELRVPFVKIKDHFENTRLNLRYQEKKATIVYEQDKIAFSQGISLARKDLFSQINDGKILPCDSYIIDRLNYNEKEKKDCYYSIEEFELVTLPSNFRLLLMYNHNNHTRGEYIFQNNIIQEGSYYHYPTFSAGTKGDGLARCKFTDSWDCPNENLPLTTDDVEIEINSGKVRNYILTPT